MKKLASIFALFILLSAFTKMPHESNLPTNSKEILSDSFSLINDTSEKVTLHTGTGIVSLNKGSKTSISCKVGKEVCWAENGKKLKVIFKIETVHCGETLKLSSFL